MNDLGPVSELDDPSDGNSSVEQDMDSDYEKEGLPKVKTLIKIIINVVNLAPKIEQLLNIRPYIYAECKITSRQ